MKLRCNKCNEIFNDDDYGDYKRFEENLLWHISKHEKDKKLGEYFTNLSKEDSK